MNPYPKPSAVGGTLIRKVIQNFKLQNFKLPITDPIAIATSGGVDSMVLAHLLSRYGRKVIDPQLITLLHFDHQWRTQSKTIEKKAVAALAKSLQVKFKSIKLESPGTQSKNWEEDARLKRQSYFEKNVGEGLVWEWVMTAHHQDDVAETLLWRFLRGEFLDQPQGILFQDNHTLRPFLKVLKEELYEYADLEKVTFFEDPGNQDTTQMRAYLRTELFPELEKRFPGVRKVIAKYPEKASKTRQIRTATLQTVEWISAALNLKLNQAQRKLVPELKTGQSVFLQGGTVLTREKDGFFLKIP